MGRPTVIAFAKLLAADDALAIAVRTWVFSCTPMGVEALLTVTKKNRPVRNRMVSGPCGYFWRQPSSYGPLLRASDDLPSPCASSLSRSVSVQLRARAPRVAPGRPLTYGEALRV